MELSRRIRTFHDSSIYFFLSHLFPTTNMEYSPTVTKVSFRDPRRFTHKASVMSVNAEASVHSADWIMSVFVNELTPPHVRSQQGQCVQQCRRIMKKTLACQMKVDELFIPPYIRTSSVGKKSFPYKGQGLQFPSYISKICNLTIQTVNIMLIAFSYSSLLSSPSLHRYRTFHITNKTSMLKL